MNRTAALLLTIGLLCAPTAFAKQKKTPAAPVPGDAAAAPSVASPDAPGPLDIQDVKAKDDFVTLNFTNIDISALVKVMSELTHRNFLLDDRVTGKVTLMTPTKMSPDEAYQVFLTALESKGFTAVEEGAVTRIIPVAAIRQSGLPVVTGGKETAGVGYLTKLIRLKYANPQEITRIVGPLVSRAGSIFPYPPTDSIILTDSIFNIRKIENLIRVMDVPAPEGEGKINVYYLRNANAEDMAKLLSGIVAHAPKAPLSSAAASPSTILEGPVSVSADKATNSLIIVASPTDYQTVRSVIEKLDIQRRQVYVEAAIIEMSLQKQRELGFELQVPVDQANLDAGKTVAVGGTNFGNIGNVVAAGPAGLAGMTGLTAGAVKGTFTFKGVQYLSVGALLHAVQTDSDVNVLSTPDILTLDNQKAEIMVGENIPFVTGQTQNATTGSQSLFNTIERKDVGISLKITPQITSDDNVRLEVYQEISDVLDSTANGPITSKRSASTTVVVKDRQTMVIAGLISDKVTAQTTKVPLLGDIPILGWLFKYKSSNVQKTNLMIFITPYIIRTEGDATELTRRNGRILEKYREKYHIQKKDSEPAVLDMPPAPAQETAAAPVVSTESTGTQLPAKPASAPPATKAKEQAVAAPQTAPTPTTTPAPAKAAPQTAPTATIAPAAAAPAPESAPTPTAAGPAKAPALHSAPTGTSEWWNASTPAKKDGKAWWLSTPTGTTGAAPEAPR